MRRREQKIDLSIVFVQPDLAEGARKLAGDMGKYSKTVANYRRPREQTLDELGKRCGHCAYFRPPKQDLDDQGACSLVAGPINPTYTCRFWKRAT